jgi:serine/threonine protein phosphatase PrpC
MAFLLCVVFQTCNLPDHPIHAGCTAIVAVITGRTLTVANAGDSRAVLCRPEGKTVALSYDHKPQQEREMSRITKAGGFVNHFGRVNGNLNLSRSIGDLKYKQVPGVDLAEQIITAEPDIVQLHLHPLDEFIILGCDGIWDCLTNEKAVEFVRNRIDRMSPTDIGIEMLNEIISEDPRVTQGLGGDNMTIMVIDLQSQSRKFRSTPQDGDAPAPE